MYERPITLQGKTHRVKTGHGNLYVTVNTDEQDKPIEVFAPIGKAGGCYCAATEALTRIISVALQNDTPLELIVAQLRGITCCPHVADGKETRSPHDALAQVLDTYVQKEAL